MSRPAIVIRPSASPRAIALLAAVLLAALLPAIATPFAVPRAADAAAMLDIVSVQHDPRGQIIASLRPAHPDAHIAEVSAYVDGALRPGELVLRASQPLSVVLAVDTSGSMAGAPLSAAKSAAINMIGRLGPADEVAVVAFADRPQVVAAFSTDRNATASTIQRLTPRGDTALYDAVALASEMLGDRRDHARVVVLLTDGEDRGSKTAQRGGSIERIRGSGAQVHAFAFGPAADSSYLAESAQATGGGFWAGADDRALHDVFARLGDRLGASRHLVIQVPPLARGDHAIELRARVDGESVTLRSAVEVTNHGLLAGRVRESEAALVLDLEVGSASPALALHAQAGDTPLSVLASPWRVIVDPWAFAPGPLDVQVTATLDGKLAAAANFTVEVARLDPQLEAHMDATEPVAVASARVQGTHAATLLATVDGREVARGPLPELRVPVPVEPGAQVRFALLDEAGVELRSAVPALAGTSDGGISSMALAATLACIAVVVYWPAQRLRRRDASARRSSREWEPNAHTMLVGRRPLAARQSAATGVLVVRDPSGDERQYTMGPKPLSLGRAAECDVVIDDDAVGALHARVIALGDGDFQLHGIAPQRHTPFDHDRDDEWIIVRDGEQIALGAYVLTVFSRAVVRGA